MKEYIGMNEQDYLERVIKTMQRVMTHEEDRADPNRKGVEHGWVSDDYHSLEYAIEAIRIHIEQCKSLQC